MHATAQPITELQLRPHQREILSDRTATRRLGAGRLLVERVCLQGAPASAAWGVAVRAAIAGTLMSFSADVIG